MAMPSTPCRVIRFAPGDLFSVCPHGLLRGASCEEYGASCDQNDRADDDPEHVTILCLDSGYLLVLLEEFDRSVNSAGMRCGVLPGRRCAWGVCPSATAVAVDSEGQTLKVGVLGGFWFGSHCSAPSLGSSAHPDR